LLQWEPVFASSICGSHLCFYFSSLRSHPHTPHPPAHHHSTNTLRRRRRFHLSCAGRSLLPPLLDAPPPSVPAPLSSATASNSKGRVSSNGVHQLRDGGAPDGGGRACRRGAVGTRNRSKRQQGTRNRARGGRILANEEKKRHRRRGRRHRKREYLLLLAACATIESSYSSPPRPARARCPRRPLVLSHRARGAIHGRPSARARRPAPISGGIGASCGLRRPMRRGASCELWWPAQRGRGELRPPAVGVAGRAAGSMAASVLGRHHVQRCPRRRRSGVPLGAHR
jgi:hypothetical protein